MKWYFRDHRFNCTYNSNNNNNNNKFIVLSGIEFHRSLLKFSKNDPVNISINVSVLVTSSWCIEPSDTVVVYVRVLGLYD